VGMKHFKGTSAYFVGGESQDFIKNYLTYRRRTII
jgi:hypothetical protein